MGGKEVQTEVPISSTAFYNTKLLMLAVILGEKQIMHTILAPFIFLYDSSTLIRRQIIPNNLHVKATALSAVTQTWSSLARGDKIIKIWQ
jgi:hypothetical protein